MSRTEARGKIHRKSGKVLKPGKVTWEMLRDWLSRRGVILKGGGLDEAPHAYRRLDEVLAAQGDTVRVLQRLRPLVVVMAGAEEFDPYRDQPYLLLVVGYPAAGARVPVIERKPLDRFASFV